MSSTTPEATVADHYDAALLDLDGTVYRGHEVIEYVPESLQAAQQHGMRSVFVTNNASRPPQAVADLLSGMGVSAVADQVLTSPQAAAALLAQRFPPDSRILIVGTDYLADEIAAAGLQPVREAAEQPVAVVIGHSPTTGWPQLAEGCLAIRAGAAFVATNADKTLPSERGLLPGAGSMVAALATATDQQPVVAGKPGRALLDAAVHRIGAQRPLVVGDRLDTDIEAAHAAGMPALMPLTGVNTAADLLTAPSNRRPTHVSFDLRGLIDNDRIAGLADPRASDQLAQRPSEWTATPGRQVITLTAQQPVTSDDDGAVLRALTAVLTAAWGSGVGRVVAGDELSGAALRRLGLGT